jgi:hypothetical protein
MQLTFPLMAVIGVKVDAHLKAVLLLEVTGSQQAVNRPGTAINMSSVSST